MTEAPVNLEGVANTTVTTKKRRAWNTTVFMKQAMALSGLFFVFFILMHCYGNLKILGGPEAYNEYAHHLRTFLMPILPYEGLLWILRVVLITLIVIHAGSAFYLWLRSAKARGSRYQVKRNAANAYAARTMRWGSIALAAFLVFHLLHFTTKHFRIGDAAAYGDGTYEVHGELVPTAPWNMMLTTFSNWYMVLAYALFVGIVAFHIGHGFWSAFQTLGWVRANTRKPLVVVSGLIGAAVFAGFITPPLFLLLTQPAPFVG